MSAMTSIDWPEAVIFDLDGTLIDSAPDIAEAVNQILADQDIAIDSQMARRCLGHGAQTFIQCVLNAHNIEYDQDKVLELTQAFNAQYEAHPCQKSQVFDGAFDTLGQLRRQGKKLGLCTNKPQTIAQQILQALGLSEYMDNITGAGTYALKPDPEPLLACMQQLGGQPETSLYIGDMAVDCQAGQAAGMTVALVEFGYSETDVAHLGADATFGHWEELHATIQALTK